jgi:DNA polymerase-3 subunit gamma/tau
MSYEVLARKWRPRSFGDVCGQRHVTTTLTNAITSGRLPHAILLAGPRGIGKTTIARLLALGLNCDKGPTPEPCGECPACREITGGTSLDVQEIDAASHTGVDNVRDIRDSIRYAAAPGKHRIFIIDEVHMLSNPAFNALLKTLEEPPPSSLFVFATTDPQRIPATVLSRVQRFDLKQIASADVLDRLGKIASAEGIDVPESVLRALVRESGGSMRDALTLLDRLVAGLGSVVTEEGATAVLDLIDRRILWDILDPILARDPARALDGVRRAFEKGIDPVRLSAELLGEIRNLVVAAMVPEPADLIDAVAEEVADIQRRALEQEPETLQRLFRVGVARQQELAWAPRPAHSVEMSVVRMATLPGAQPIATLVDRLEALAGSAPSDGGGSPGGSGGGSGRSSESRRGPRPPSPSASRSASAPGPEPARPPVQPEEPPPPEAPVPSAPRPSPLESAPAPRAEWQSEGQRLARLKQEAKAHPAVQEVIEVLDAELREIRTREGAP